MTTVTAPAYSEADLAVINKAYLRIVPFMFLGHVVNYLDRINVGFAALSMNKALGLTATTFGLSATVFYLAYVFFEIPSNLCLAKYGARLWLSRILVTWGAASAATGLAVGMWSLYGVRVLVGIAEAGFIPGLMLCLTYWIPSSHRARANSLGVMAGPVAMIVGAGASGLILQHLNGFLHVAGWRWMFFFEGVPAVFVGIIGYFYLSDRPKDALTHWLREDEKTRLTEILERDRQTKQPVTKSHRSVFRQLLEKDVILLFVTYFCVVNTISANGTWIPTIVREVLTKSSLSYVGFVSAIPPICALFVMPFWARSSDRRGERIWHLICAMLLCAIGWMIVVVAHGSPQLRLLGLCCTTSGGFCSMAVFWSLPQTLLSKEAGPVGIALINMGGLLGSAFSPAVIGYLRDLTGAFAAGLYYATGLLLIGVVLVLCVSNLKKDQLRTTAATGSR